MINGRPRGKFSASRRLRQGDPLSTYLFTIAVDVLSSIENRFGNKHYFEYKFGGQKVVFAGWSYGLYSWVVASQILGVTFRWKSLASCIFESSGFEGGEETRWVEESFLSKGEGKKNEALLAKWWWRFPLETETLWYKVIVGRCGLNQNGPESVDALRVTYRCPWKPVHSVADILFQRVKWKIGSGEIIYNHWLSNIKDWCISRQLWWGHRIPVWYIEGKDNEEEYIVARSAVEALKKAQEKYGKGVQIYQDPDVLDTWFSSALWPFSTLGWPDVSSEDFKQFYPTTMLETGHDILFFWVARMVMMGIEFTGTVPFSYVYLHGLIRDSQGRKMSKTLGNVIDPLDTIKEFGTDALRFTLALGTAGQDLNLSTERLTANKAFTNKLWNAGKFVLQNLPSQDEVAIWENINSFHFDTKESLHMLPLPECWVISKLHLLIDAVTASYDKFFFGDVGREMYDFFWADFADWYIEASKARLYHSGGYSVASVSQAVLFYVFQNILKLLHPFMPFVTEELWQALPNRQEALIVSPWPQTSLPRDGNSIKKFENLQALTRAIRNARAEYSVEPAKRISASVVANDEVIQYVSKEKEVLALLSRLDLQNVHFTNSPPGNADQSVHLVAGEGLEAYLPLADMVDITAEVERLTKRLSKMQTEYQGLASRLSSPKFVEKAPEDIVRGVQEKAAETEEKITLTKNRLALLKSSALVTE
ncbi:Valine--tRNA ligase [Morus notabilis]|uniref:valine--tRNA ligase n=1 Tax=Morus notabilis TaxID=981085 RepID=W9SBS5_9ROSA|nr:Valine--tRNA ligase [Morus notabilis]